MGNVKRNTWATVGRILALIGALLVIIGAVFLLLDKAFDFAAGVGTDPLISVGSGDTAKYIGLIIAVIVAVIILLLELDKWVLTSHLARGILYVVLFLVAPAGLLILLAGIFYIIAEFT